MATKLGKIGITLEGVYDPTKEYDKLSCVIYNGESWVSRVSVPAGNVPGASTFWQKFSERGETGPQGPQGEQGIQGPQGIQGNSGYSGAADELEVVNNLISDDATAALSAQMGKNIGDKLAQLDQEWQEIKDANFNIIVNPHVEVVDMGAATAATIEPDKYYIFGEVATLAVGLAAAQEGTIGNYAFQFTSPAEVATTLSLPLGVKFPKESDSTLQIKAKTIYQISILNNLAIATSWEV